MYSKKNNLKKEKEVIKSNLKFFSAKAADYNKEEPSYRPENISRVNKILKDCLKKKKNARILDIGCGTGFIIDIAKKYTPNIFGVDISPDMLHEVNLEHGMVKLSRADTANLPLKDNYFDLCTAYGFLHHLYDVNSTFKEAYRCLKKGGILYSDQDPNYYYWENARIFDSKSIVNEIPKKEIIHVHDPTVDYKTKNLKSLKIAGRKTILNAEFQKTVNGGFREEEIKKLLKKVGFRKILYDYEWYLGEAFTKHRISSEADKIINEHLRRCLPLTRHLFKYVRIIAIK